MKVMAPNWESSQTISPRSAIGPGEQLTRSRPISAPERDARAAAIIVSTGIRTSMFQFMVMLTVYATVLTRSYRGNPGRWTTSVVRENWGEGLRTAATLIPTRLRAGLSPVELSERRES